MRYFPGFLLLVSMLFQPQAFMQAGGETLHLSGISVTYTFREEIVFHAVLEAELPIEELFLFVQPAGGDPRLVAVPTQDVVLNCTFDPGDDILSPFSPVYFWFRASFADGSQKESPRYWFRYEDNRYPWQTLENECLSIHWYEGDLPFGQMILDVATRSIQSAQRYVPVEKNGPIEIYVYDSGAAMQDALQYPEASRVSSYSNPPLNLIFISVTPEDNWRMPAERQIPHEIAHILQYRFLGQAYQNLPAWLSEGSASLAELYPNPDYERTLQSAVSGASLLPVETLCAPIQPDTNQAVLAYAESASFTRYLYEKFGSNAMHEVYARYRDWQSCSAGVEEVLHIPLSELEIEWMDEELGVKIPSRLFAGLLPFLVIPVLILIIPLVIVLPGFLHKLKSRPRENSDE